MPRPAARIRAMATSGATPAGAMASQATKTVPGMVIAISHARRSVGTSKLASYCILSKCPLRPFARESGGDSLISSSRNLHQPSHERKLGSRVAFVPAPKLEVEQRTEEHTPELPALMRTPYAAFSF